MRDPRRRLAGAILLALAGIAATTAQSPANDFHGWLRSGNVTAVAAAIEKDPGLATRPDAQGIQPLAWAAFYGQKAVFDLLLARGADPRAPNPVIGTVLHAAVLGGQPEIIRTLAARGIDLNAGGEARFPPLVFAARRGLATSAVALLEAGASVNARDAGGNTALLLAASYGQTAMVRALLARKADVASANDRGVTPIEAALREGHTAVVELLRAGGATAPAIMPVLTGPYLGQPPPDESRRVFAPRIVSTERRELNAAFTPDGRAFFFSRDGTGPTTGILMATFADDAWREPRPAPFGRPDASDVDMFVTADGSEIYFCSDRPQPDQTASAPVTKESRPRDSDIWVARRQGAAWGSPTWLGPEVNARGADDYYPTLTRTGTLYFSSNRPGGLGENDIYRARRVNGRWTTPENLGAPVNTSGREFDPFIAPDESYLVFASERAGGLGASDLYVSARNKDGSWATPVNLGPRVNSAFADYTPMVSPDGRYLFLTSGAPGSDDLYWIPASVIRKAIEANAKRPPLALTCVANAGVVVRAGDTKILIDALFDRPNPDYRAPTADAIDGMVNGSAPFEDVRLALVTHNHPDHFDARVALRFLENRRDAVLVAPTDAVEAMRAAAADWSRVAPRVVIVDGPAGTRIERKVGSVSITTFRTNHGSNPTPPNVMYLVNVNGWTVFHEGDSPGDPEEYKRFGLGSGRVDLALVHFWFPTDPNCALFLQQALRPDHIALTHLPIRLEGDAPAKIDAVRKYYRDIFLLLPNTPPRLF